MSKQTNSESCILCEGSAEWVSGDYNNYRDYHCTNNGCGDYRISSQAIRKFASDTTLKSQARKAASLLNGTEKIPVITIESIKSVEKRSIRLFTPQVQYMTNKSHSACPELTRIHDLTTLIGLAWIAIADVRITTQQP